MREEPSRYAPTVPAENTVDLLMSTARSLRRALAAAMAGWGVTPHHARCAAEEFLAVLPVSDRRTLDRILRTLVEEEH